MTWMIWHKHRKHSTADKKGSFSLYLHAIGIETYALFMPISEGVPEIKLAKVK